MGGWQGILGDDGETVELTDAAGRVVDAVRYASDGDWAVRRLGPPDFANRRGWDWYALHAGGGHSLERRRFDWESRAAHNWDASVAPGGTPGAVNSRAAELPPPMISQVQPYPLVPGTNDAVRFSCRVVALGSAPPSVLLKWRLDGAPAWIEVPMRDDGLRGDGLAGDGRYGASIPAQAQGAIVEWLIEATDANAQRRVYPAVESDVPARTGHPVYQVDHAAGVGSAQPEFRLVLPEAERDYLATEIWAKRPDSDAAVNGTFISRDGVTSDAGGEQIRFLCGIRNRGHGTRTFSPHNIHVSFGRDGAWKDRSAINLNTSQVPSQQAGGAVYRWLGMPVAPSDPVQVRLNGANLARPGPEQYGSYAFNQPIDDRFATTTFPDDPDGNLYRGVRDMLPGIRADADLKWLGASHTNYTNAYRKENHADRQDWADLVGLIDVLNHAPEETYLDMVSAVMDVDQWVRYFAISILLGNQENSLANGSGDDFALYRGLLDPRFKVIPYDMDSLLGRGSRTNTHADGIWRMTNVPAMNRFITHPGIAPRYLRELRELATNAFAPSLLNPRLDQWLGAYVDARAIANMKAFATSQVAHVLAQFPHALRVDHGLTATGGVLRATAPTLHLTGEADPSRTWSVTVQGTPATWSPVRGTWEAGPLTLRPGLQRVQIVASGEFGEVVEEQVLDISWDNSPFVTAPASIVSDTLWSVADGPRLLASTLTVQGGATLRIAAGTTVYLAAGADLVVSPAARLIVEGTAEAPVHFTRAPGSAAAWGGIQILGGPGSPESVLKHLIVEGNGDTAIHVTGGSAWLEALRFRTTDRQYVSLDDASFVVKDCEFPSGNTGFELVHGTGGIRPGGRGVFFRNFFGGTIGYNDVIDFTGGNRPSNPVLHVLDNVFNGSTDDILDLDGTDAWVEGNIFLHVHRNGSPDSASAISGGSDGGDTSEVTVVGNLFFDVDHVATAKQGNFYVLQNNTIVRQTRVGGLDTDAAVVNFADDGTTEGAGMVIAHNVIHDVEKLTRNQSVSRVTWIDNLLPPAWEGTGTGTSTSAPRFKHLPTLEKTRALDSWAAAQGLWEWLAPGPGSGARGAGPHGSNLGAYRGSGLQVALPREAIVAGRALEVWPLPSFRGDGLLPAVFPGAAGYLAWRYSIDGQPWSDPVEIGRVVSWPGLAAGLHEIALLGRRDTGLWQDDPVFASAGLAATRVSLLVASNATPASPLTVRLSEILADGSAHGTNVATVDWIEVENFGGSEVDLAGAGLSDRDAQPYRFQFPPGSRLAPGARLVIPEGGVGVVLGFGLERSGGTVRLVAPLPASGQELDVLRYGHQLPGRSVARAPDGTWVLCAPTPLLPNRVLPTAGIDEVRINEWLADAQFRAAGDFVELLNLAVLPADLGGASLSEAPGSVARHVFPPLTFIDAKATRVGQADGDSTRGDEHLAFELPPDGGVILLSDSSGRRVDSVVYGPQRTDVAEGRTPDGGSSIAAFAAPTPGAPNPGVRDETCEVVTETVPLLSWNAVWRYHQTGNLDGVPWTSPGFDDSAWPYGPGLLAVEDCNCLPAPGIGTPLQLGRMTYYFRARVEVPTNLAGFQLHLATVLDDGMVVHLNGTHVLTVGMETDTPTYDTDASRNVGNGSVESFTLPPGELGAGPLVIAVEVHQANTTSSDIAFGLELAARRSMTNCTPGAGSALRLSELAAASTPGDDAFDFVELVNTGTAPADLGGIGVTDDPSVPARWRVPAGTRLESGARLVVRCDGSLPSSATNTGFGLRMGGGAIHLHDRVDRGGALIDALHYGIQVPGTSLARVREGNGEWTLAEPTPGAANRALALGSPTRLRLNEWLADSSSGEDWFEIWNGGDLPVALGGLGLTDAPTNPGAEIIAPLSFIGAGARGFVQIHADGNPAAGADHVGFALRKAGESLGLLTHAGILLDAITFGPQATDQSEGRYPDGAETHLRFVHPTPARPNEIAIDTDGDGLTDAWELIHFGGLDATGAGDGDGDGFSNRGEYLAGTDPRDAASHLALVAARDGTVVLLRWSAVAGRMYDVQFRESLGEGAWQTLTRTSGEGPIQVADPSSDLHDARFYRLVVSAAP